MILNRAKRYIKIFQFELEIRKKIYVPPKVENSKLKKSCTPPSYFYLALGVNFHTSPLPWAELLKPVFSSASTIFGTNGVPQIMP